MGRIERLGIPGLLFSDGPRGVVMGKSTAFPVSMARGATWDVALEERVGTVIGRELRAQGANFFGGVCVNLPRHPAWGRAQETYGEDPVLLGEFGAALTRGAAQRHGRRQALRAQQHGERPLQGGRHRRRGGPARGLPGALPQDRGRGRVGRHDRLQLGQRRVGRAERAPDGGRAPRHVGLRGRHRLRLHLGPARRRRLAARRSGRGGALPPAARRAPARRPGGGPGALGRRRPGGPPRPAHPGAPLRLLAEPEPSLDVVFSPEHRALAREVAARGMVLLKNDPVGDAPVLPCGGTPSPPWRSSGAWRTCPTPATTAPPTYAPRR